MNGMIFLIDIYSKKPIYTRIDLSVSNSLLMIFGFSVNTTTFHFFSYFYDLRIATCKRKPQSWEQREKKYYSLNIYGNKHSSYFGEIASFCKK